MLVKNAPRYSFLKCAPPRIERFFGPLIQQKDKLLLQWPPSVTGGQNNSCVTQKQTNGGHGETTGAILLPPNNHGMLRLRARAAGGKPFARKRRVLKPDRVSQACSFFLNSRHTQRSVTICSRNEYPYSTQPTSHMCTDAKPYAENLRVSECGRVPFLNLQFSCYRVSATAQIEILLQRQRGQAKAAG